LSRGGAIGFTAVLEYVVPIQTVVLTWKVSRFEWLKMDQLWGSAGRWQTEVLCLLVFGRSQFSQILVALFVWFSVLCYIVREVADTLKWREICAVGQQSEVLCPRIFWWVKVLLEACRSLWFSALCFSFMDPGRKELRERQNERKKVVDWLGLSDPVSNYSQLVNRQ
jgi:hypothetical protein